MRSGLTTTARWCPVCEGRGVPIVWGEPSEYVVRLAEEGHAIIGGCTPIGLHPSHACRECETEFIASDRIYRRETGGDYVLGVGVWPHGRRPVRIEENDEGWTVVVAGEGSMLIAPEVISVVIGTVFQGIRP